VIPDGFLDAGCSTRAVQHGLFNTGGTPHGQYAVLHARGVLLLAVCYCSRC